MEIQFAFLNGVPRFIVNDSHHRNARIYGALFDEKTNSWSFPAYPPFIANVLYDISKVYKDSHFTEEAFHWQENLKSQEAWLEHLKTLTLPRKSHAHQLEGTAELLYNYRWILKWETGTGKTKPVIDAISQLHCKALVLCPRIALDNWVKECEINTNGALKALALKGDKAGKLARLSESSQYDILVTTFDSARTYGSPRLFPKTLKLFKNSIRVPHQQVLRMLKGLNHVNEQMRLAEEWIRGKKPREIQEEIRALVKDNPQWLTDLSYDMIVADESHRIKNRHSDRTHFCLKLAQRAQRRYLLTGTLSQGNPWDLYPQGKFLASFFMPENSRQFEDRYIITTQGQPPIIVGYKNLNVLNQRIARISSERLLDDCVDLPPRRFETLYVSLSPEQIADYNDIVLDHQFVAMTNERLDFEHAVVRLAKLLQICSGFVYLPEMWKVCDTCPHVVSCVSNEIRPGTGRCKNKTVFEIPARSQKYHPNPKLELLEEKLRDIVPHSKVIIWGVFKEELNLIEDMLKRRKWGYVRVDGDNVSSITKHVDAFEHDDACRIYLGQIKTGIAISLNAAKYSIYYSRSWSLDDRIQSLGRNRRIGQNQKTVVYDICVEKTLEEQQLLALESKEDIAQLLTKKVNCLLCTKYRNCLKEAIKPWDTGCKLDTRATRVVAHINPIEEE